MAQNDAPSPFRRHRPALLVATICGGLVAIGSVFAGMSSTLYVGALMFLAGGFVYLSTGE